MSLRFDLAAPEDDPELRRLLRENPFAGSISISFEREPNYFHASAVEGPFHQTLVARETESGKIVGMGDRSARPLYVNGELQTIGYFSGLRARPDYQRGMALARYLSKGFKGQRKLHADGRVPYYLMSIVADNDPARRLLESSLPNFPRLFQYTRLHTLAIHPARPLPSLRAAALWRRSNLRIASGEEQMRPRNDGYVEEKLKITRGSADLIPAIVDCLTRNGMRRQFAPHWTEETLLSPLTPGLSISDFFLAQSGSRVRGCLALWDQSSIKQSVVRGYSGNLARYRKLVNLLAPLGFWAPLPKPGTRLNQCFASFLAVDDDDPEIFAALLRAVHNEAARRKCAYLLLGLAEDSPFLPIAQTYRPITYKSGIYLAAWEDGYEATARVDDRTSALEIALL